MKFRVIKYSSIPLIFLLLVEFLILPLKISADESLNSKSDNSAENTAVEYYRKINEPYYATLLKEYEQRDYKNNQNPEIVIDSRDIILLGSRELKFEVGLGGNNYPAFKWIDDIPWIEWTFEIDADGLYEVSLEYYMLPGTGNPATRSLKMDGNIPFFEASNIVFYRGWKDEGEPIVNSIGDEVRPSQVEIPGWRVMELLDAQGYYPHLGIYRP